MLTSAIKKKTSVCCSISLNPYMVFQTWNLESRIKKVKRKAILLLAYCLTNRSFYMRTLSLTKQTQVHTALFVRWVDVETMAIKHSNFQSLVATLFGHILNIFTFLSVFIFLLVEFLKNDSLSSDHLKKKFSDYSQQYFF